MRSNAAAPRRHLLVTALLSIGLLSLSLLTACGGDNDDPVPPPAQEVTPSTLTLEKIGGFNRNSNGTHTLGAAEITAYDPASRRLFVVNGANGTVDVVNFADPTAPVLISTIDVSSFGAGVNSVAVHNGLVALAVEASAKTSPGYVAFYNAATATLIGTPVQLGALPDMVTFTPDGLKVLVANEGEPNSYGQSDSVDPEGSVSIVTLNRGGSTTAPTLNPTVQTANFQAFNGQEAALRAQGIRIFGPGATAAQDFEPEYITVSDDSRTAYVTLQENNAIATVDIATATVTAVRPLGYKDHSVAGMGFDASDRDNAINIRPQPVKGMYLPDAITSYTLGSTTYLVTANEGDARADWPGFNEESRVSQHCTAGLDPAIFPDAANLILDANLGRLRITSAPNGGTTGKNTAGQCTELYAFGGRSFSIWAASDLSRVYDSGDEFEQRTQNLANVNFNASNDNNTLESRSASKGPEPEGVTVARFGTKTFAFVGLERVGGVMVYDVTTPATSTFVTYLNTRTGNTGDRGPEGLTFIKAADSPNGRPLLVVGHETSGTTAVYQINLVN